MEMILEGIEIMKYMQIGLSLSERRARKALPPTECIGESGGTASGWHSSDPAYFDICFVPRNQLSLLTIVFTYEKIRK